MSSYEITFTLPVPVASVVPAGALAAAAVGKGVREQRPTSLVCKGSWLRILGYRVTLKLNVAGTDGAAIVSLVGSNSGFGPINSNLCKKEADEFWARLVAILQQWAAHAGQAAATPVPPPIVPAWAPPPPAAYPPPSWAQAPLGPVPSQAWTTPESLSRSPLLGKETARRLAVGGIGATVFGIVATWSAFNISDAVTRTIVVVLFGAIAGLFLLSTAATLWSCLLRSQDSDMHRQLLKGAVLFTLLVAPSFYLIPVPPLRAVVVVGLGAIAVILTIALAAVLLMGLFKGPKRRLSWALMTGMALVLAAQTISIAGLNNYADGQIVSGTALIQGDFAQVAVSVAQGDAVAAGHAPSGVTFTTIAAADEKVSRELMTYNTPGELVDYAGRVGTWADQVDSAALGADTGGQWQNVQRQPDPFQLTMTSDQANSAYTTSAQQIATLISFGSYALANKDQAGFLWVGARIAAQDYWLEGVYASADANPIEANLHFIEASSLSASSANISALTAPLSDAGLDLPSQSQPSQLALSGHRSWGTPRPWRPGGGWCELSCFPQLRTKLNHLTNISYGAVGQAFTTSYAAAESGWSASQTEILPLIGADSFPPVPPAAPAKGGQGPPPPQAFYNQCVYGGGTVTYVSTLGSSSFASLPTDEGGWSCSNPNPNSGWPNSGCWSYLSASGIFSQGGGFGCPEANLVPAPFGPLGDLASRAGSIANTIIQPGPSGQSGGATWDGTYRLSGLTGGCAGSAFDALDPATAASVKAAMQTALNQSAASVLTLFVVQNDSIVDGDLAGGNLAIAAGQAQTSVSEAGVSIDVTFSFSGQSSNGAQVAETISMTETGMQCTFTASGTRS